VLWRSIDRAGRIERALQTRVPVRVSCGAIIVQAQFAIANLQQHRMRREFETADRACVGQM
jgi:hypothetical protein